MNIRFLLGTLLPLAAAAQKPVATMPLVTCHVGLQKAPLYRNAADTAKRTSLYLPSQAEADVVGRFSPRWVVIKREGFLYLTPTRALRDYDPVDADPLPLNTQSQRIAYEGVVAVPGVSEADLYARASAWIAKTYNASDVVTGKSAQGELLVKGARLASLFRPYEGVLRQVYAGVIRHTLTIYVKDGRYKYQLTDLTHDAGSTLNLKSGGPLEQSKGNLFGYVGLGSQKPWDDMKVAATRDARHLMEELQAAMTGHKVVTASPAEKISKAPKDPRDF